MPHSLCIDISSGSISRFLISPIWDEAEAAPVTYTITIGKPPSSVIIDKNSSFLLLKYMPEKFFTYQVEWEADILLVSRSLQQSAPFSSYVTRTDSLLSPH